MASVADSLNDPLQMFDEDQINLKELEFQKYSIKNT